MHVHDSSHAEQGAVDDGAEYRQHGMEEAIDCTFCVLAEHQHSLIEQKAELVVRDFPDDIAVGTTFLICEATAHAVNLRGPPFSRSA